MKLNAEAKTMYIETARVLKGSERRQFMARVVEALGPGGQRRAAVELGWCRDTIRKGQREMSSGQPIIDNFAGRGRKPAEEHLPNLLEDIRAIADEQSQTDPTFQTTRLYTRISAAEMRRQLIAQRATATRSCRVRKPFG